MSARRKPAKGKPVDRRALIQRAADRAGITSTPRGKNTSGPSEVFSKQEPEPTITVKLRQLLSFTGEGYTCGGPATPLQIALSAIDGAGAELHVLADAFPEPGCNVLFQLGCRLKETARIVSAIDDARSKAGAA